MLVYGEVWKLQTGPPNPVSRLGRPQNTPSRRIFLCCREIKKKTRLEWLKLFSHKPHLYMKVYIWGEITLPQRYEIHKTLHRINQRIWSGRKPKEADRCQETLQKTAEVPVLSWEGTPRKLGYSPLWYDRRAFHWHFFHSQSWKFWASAQRGEDLRACMVLSWNSSDRNLT